MWFTCLKLDTSVRDNMLYFAINWFILNLVNSSNRLIFTNLVSTSTCNSTVVVLITLMCCKCVATLLNWVWYLHITLLYLFWSPTISQFCTLNWHVLLTHCSLVTPNDDINLDACTWTKVRLLSNMLGGIHNNFLRSAHELNPFYMFGNNLFKITTTFPIGQWVNFALIFNYDWHVIYESIKHDSVKFMNSLLHAS